MAMHGGALEGGVRCVVHKPREEEGKTFHTLALTLVCWQQNPHPALMIASGGGSTVSTQLAGCQEAMLASSGLAQVLERHEDAPGTYARCTNQAHTPKV